MDCAGVTYIDGISDTGLFGGIRKKLRKASRKVKKTVRRSPLRSVTRAARRTVERSSPVRRLKSLRRGIKPLTSNLRRAVRVAEPLAVYGSQLAPYVPGGGTTVGAGLGVLRAWGRGETDLSKLAMAGARGALPPAARAGLRTAQALRSGKGLSLSDLNAISRAAGGPSLGTYGPGKIGPQRVAPRSLASLTRLARTSRKAPDRRPWARWLDVRGLNADGVTWTIQSGDTLSGIASKVIQDASRWREIVAANPDKPKHPDWGLWLNPGDVIKLPASWVGAPAEPVAPIPEPTIVPSTPGLPEAPAEVVEAVEEVLPGLVGTLPTILTGGQATSETVSADTILEIKSLLGYWGTAHVADGRNPHVDYPSLNEENQPEWTRRDQSMAQAFNQWWEDNSRQPEIAAEEDWDQPTAGLLARLKLWNVEWLASHAAAEAQEAVEEAVEQVTPEEPAMPAEVPPLPGAPTAEPVVGPGGEAPQQATPPEVVPPLPGAPTAGPAPEGEEAGAGAAVAALGAIGAAVAYGTGALKF